MEPIIIRKVSFAPDNLINKKYITFEYSTPYGSGREEIYCSKPNAIPQIIKDHTIKYNTIELGDATVRINPSCKLTYKFTENRFLIAGGHIKGTDFSATFGMDSGEVVLVNPPESYTFKVTKENRLSWSVNRNGITEIKVGNHCSSVKILSDGAMISTFCIEFKENIPVPENKKTEETVFWKIDSSGKPDITEKKGKLVLRDDDEEMTIRSLFDNINDYSKSDDWIEVSDDESAKKMFGSDLVSRHKDFGNQHPLTSVITADICRPQPSLVSFDDPTAMMHKNQEDDDDDADAYSDQLQSYLTKELFEQ